MTFTPIENLSPSAGSPSNLGSLSTYPRSIIMLYPFRTTFPLFAIPFVPPGSPVVTSVLWMAVSWEVGSVETFPWFMVFFFPVVSPVGSFLVPSVDQSYSTYTRSFDGSRGSLCLLPLPCFLSIFHVLFECPSYSVPRNWFFPSLT